MLRKGQGVITPPPDGAEVQWHTSSFSHNVDCFEVGFARNVVLVRDTKNRELPPVSFGSSTWIDFTAAVRRGEFSSIGALEVWM
ncbi:DUF397 domain-containing protein [Pseudonocardia lacus]|uniref:DUF397 domain-containing protein n=1 Tax=Pseudonocardia lacus TaxID=2835865 RepID=UPI001BDC6FF3|nr:DUF397 domain-containing protein [Pseudonocardia lacus]